MTWFFDDRVLLDPCGYVIWAGNPWEAFLVVTALQGWVFPYAVLNAKTAFLGGAWSLFTFESLLL